ncbi:MAG: hypothetical protein WC989_04475 [Micavibrio sp.]
MAIETTSVEEKGGFLSSIRNRAMWVVDNGLYNTKEPWNSNENLFNIGFLGASVVAGAFTAGGGTAAMLGGRVALGAAGKGALRAGVTEVAVSAPAMAALSPALAYANDRLDDLLAGDEEATAEDQDAAIEAEADIEASPKAALSLSDTFNNAVNQWDDYIPLPLAKVIAGITTLFKAVSDMTSGNTSSFDIGGLSKIFSEMVSGETPAVAKAEPAAPDVHGPQIQRHSFAPSHDGV